MTPIDYLKDFDISKLPDISTKTFAIITAEWNENITFELRNGAIEFLQKCNVPEINIIQKTVPGTFELALGAQKLAIKENIDAIICLGCVIQGDTKHFDFICNAASIGIMEVGLKYNKPVIFGVLTTNNEQQAIDRSGGIMGNKGVEAALTAIKMLSL